MKINEFLRRTLFYISVPECVCCREKLDINDFALCKSCLKKYLAHKATQACSLCFNTYDECVCVNETLKKGGIKRLSKCYRYVTYEETLPSNCLIYSLKRDNRRDVLSFLAKDLSASIIYGIPNYKDLYITNVARRGSSIVKYGFDHTALLAREVAKELDIPYIKTLRSRAKHSQKKLSHRQRSENARFKVISPKRVESKSFLIIDDIVTTGSSMSFAASALKNAGATVKSCAAIAIAFRDENK